MYARGHERSGRTQSKPLPPQMAAEEEARIREVEAQWAARDIEAPPPVQEEN